MASRKTCFTDGEIYHVFNRGTDKRAILLDHKDLDRFLQSMIEFNSVEPIGSIYENSFREGASHTKPLVDVICYAIMTNHFHLLIRQATGKGIEKFMQRLCMGYCKYFNNRHRRSGTLFQGKFRAAQVDTNEYLLRLAAYINLNDRVHQLGHQVSKLCQTSWFELTRHTFTGPKLCSPAVILEQFESVAEFKEFASEALSDIKANKNLARELEDEGNLDTLRPSEI